MLSVIRWIRIGCNRIFTSNSCTILFNYIPKKQTDLYLFFHSYIILYYLGPTYNGLAIYNPNWIDLFLNLYYLQSKRSKMKDLKFINSIAVAIPLTLVMLAIFDGVFLYLAAYSTMITGFLQVVIALIALSRNKKNIYIIIYLSLVILFFSLWYYNININYNDSLTWPLFFTPLFLCIYLSIIIYNQKETK